MRFLFPILYPLSLFFRLLLHVRHFFYDHHLFSTNKAPLPVISVGNIVVGGSGKTSLVYFLAKELQRHFLVAVASRGYGSPPRTLPLRVASNTPYVRCGDEPLLLSRLLPHVHVYVCKNRLLAARQAHAEGAKILLLDDGMQHRKIARDLEIVLLDSKNPFAKSRFLPYGLLRELPQRLACADLLVLNHVEEGKDYASLRGTLACYTKAPVVGMRYQLRTPLPYKRVGVFCALGTPQRFLEMLYMQKVEVVATLLHADHKPFFLKELTTFAKRCQSLGAEAILCTEKDAVKLPFELYLPLPVLPLHAELEIVFGKEEWQKVLQKSIHLGKT